MNLGVAVHVIASSKDGNLIVTGDVDGKVVFWDTSLQKRCEAAERHGKMITALDVSSHRHVASGSNDGTVIVWKMGKPGFPPVPGPLMHHGSISVSSVKFSPAGSHIASACAHWGCGVRIWHTRTGDQIESIRIDGSPTHSLAWSSDGRRLFAGCSNGSISCLDVITRKPFSKVVEPRPGDDSISSLHVSNSDQFLISFSAPGRTVDIWDIRDTPAYESLRSYSRCISASVSPDDLYLASSGDNTKIYIRSLSAVVEASYFFHRLAPSLSHSEPFTYISPAAHRAWKIGELQQVEDILSREIEDKRYQGFACYARANRALVRIRREDLIGALDDAGKILTNGAQIPPIAHIAKAMAFIRQGNRTEAIDAFESVHHGDAKVFVQCVKSVILFEVELRDNLNYGAELAELPPLADASFCPWVETRKLLLLAEHCMRRAEYNEGLQLLAKAPDLGPFLHVPESKIIPLVFGWDIYDLQYMVQQLICQALFASGRTREVMDFLQVNENSLDEENEARKADLGWLGEKLGDEAMGHKKYDDAITWYSVSLGLCPESRVIDCGSEFAKKCLSAIEVASDAADGAITKDLVLMARYPPGSARLLVKRSKAKAFKEFWHNALEDADQAIDMDKLCPWGYERRYMALHALHRYQEATKTLGKMVTEMEESADPSIRQLRTKYVAPAETIKKIDEQIDAIREISPLVLIDVRTGNLCDAAERIRIFKTDPIFHELVSSMSTELDTNRVERVVARYFRYVMFSHTWEGKEPTFQDFSEKSVYELDPHPLKLKLRCFCDTVRDDPEGYLWAWSDTCCIDKTIETVYRKSIRSMYSWYKHSAITIVLLAPGSTPSTLKNNRWMTRAWTLQELLSPKSIRFYDRDWELYRGDTCPNHKESPHIMWELAEAVDVAQDILVDFSPKSLSIRAKLRLASTREATEKVDIAYALIGIFSSDLIPEYRDPEDALGLLLQEIVHRERDAKAVLDWVGKSSQFNSCLPAQISAYQVSPYTPPPIPENKMEARVAELRALLPQQDVAMFFGNLSTLSSIDFTHRRLSLPCITFSVSVDTARYDEASSASSQSIVYQAQAAAIGQLEFKTSCTVFMAQDEYVLVYPWIRDLLSQINLPQWDNYTRALRLVVHLEQPFRALLLVKQSIDTYKRVALSVCHHPDACIRMVARRPSLTAQPQHNPFKFLSYLILRGPA
ncbi:hypothetical protein PAXINDRAFT_15388 [Paxillus involutus ATCC 200175]|uniref:Heterokaryon incompatibility domain-containing protein n=1 Tax=Paxillus involutus ATCC 200175 TaxID=664439 RepID=A0A0C9T818_PAXIN|nr:hypothetical protein PAXINDRAFT_15388 [Paxillus involutus ATCC 200175]